MVRPAQVEAPLSRTSLPAAAFYREFRPSPDMQNVVACLWVSVVGRADTAARPIIPDGCADIMVFDDERPCVAGPDAETRWSSLREGMVITGLRLRPGAMPAVLGCSAYHLVNGGAALADLARGTAILHRNLQSTDTLRMRHTLLETWVRNALGDLRDEDRAILAACHTLTVETGLDIGELADRLDWSARTLQRKFLTACGYGPKHFQRIMRVQKALRAMHDAPDRQMADAALQTGFADQAHLTRDFRAITGFTPRAYLALSGREFGAWLSEDWLEAAPSVRNLQDEPGRSA